MSGTSKAVVYSWDANVFVAHFKQESNKDYAFASMRAVYEQIERGAAEMLVSVIVLAEMLDVIDNSQIRDQFNRLLRRPNVRLQDVTPQIARKTAAMRAEWRNTGIHAANESRNIKTPDAIIMATAVVHGASVLHSFEPKFHRHSKTSLVSEMQIVPPILFGGQQVLPG